MKVAVVGGGVAGLFTAFFLRQEGVEVVIIEQGEVGQWSRAAAGILEFTRLVLNRINTSAYVRRYVKMMLRGEARVKTWDLPWISSYLKTLGRKPSQEMWEGMKVLGDISRRQYRALAESKNDFNYVEEPLYEISDNVEEALEESRRDPLSPKVEIAQCCGREALAYLDAAKISTEDLVERMKRELSGVEFVNRKVEEVAGREVWLEGGAVIRADEVVVAAGYWARKFGIPVAPFKGYGFRTTAKTQWMLMDMSRGFAVVPLWKWTKITGRFDLDGSGDNTPAQKVINNAKKEVGDFQIIDMAVGYRPCTPDGFPVVDRIGSVVVVTGGCRLGWTFGPALGKIAADMALGRRGIDAFGAWRFRR